MSENSLRQELLSELEFIKSLGRYVFLYPFIGRTKLEMVGFFIMHFLVLCTAFQLTMSLLSCDATDWVAITNVAPNLGVVLMTIIKYTKTEIHKEFYNEIFLHYRDDMWDIVSPESVEHQKIIKKYKWIIMVINRFILYYSIPLIVIVNSLPYLMMVYENKFHGVTDEYLFPFDGWYPFDKEKWYIAAYMWESAMTAVVIFVYVFGNSIHLSYILFISMELRIIGNQLENLISSDDVDAINNENISNDFHLTVVRKLKVLIKKHYFLIRISNKLDYVLGDGMLLTYFVGSIFICLAAFTFTIEENLYKSIRYFSMCFSLLVETFDQCLMGQVLSDHSENLTKAVYSCNWIYANPETKKIMLMFMLRTQKPFVLTGKGYIVMNMTTFSAICSTSYQLFNLLRTMYL